MRDPLDPVADLLARFAHRVAEIFGGEGVRVNIDVHGVVALRAFGLLDDTQIERIDPVAAQYLTYFVDLRLIQRSGPREDRRALPMGERQLLAGEYAGVIVVIRREHHVGRATGQTWSQATKQSVTQCEGIHFGFVLRNSSYGRKLLAKNRAESFIAKLKRNRVP